jgi:hypothetical protein
MNANLKCSNCGSVAQVTNYNVARLGSNCHVCGRWGSVSELLTNFYGATVGKIARTLLQDTFNRRRSQTSDLREELANIDRRIELAISEARA